MERCYGISSRVVFHPSRRKPREHQLTAPVPHVPSCGCNHTGQHGRPHHATPRRPPELFWNGELQSLCATCHSLFKQSEEKGGTRHLSGCDASGEPPFFEW
jgi:hypothetical protein